MALQKTVNIDPAIGGKDLAHRSHQTCDSDGSSSQLISPFLVFEFK